METVEETKKQQSMSHDQIYVMSELEFDEIESMTLEEYDTIYQ